MTLTNEPGDARPADLASETDPLDPNGRCCKSPDTAGNGDNIMMAEKEEDKGSSSSIWLLYISRALTAWGDRLWAFGLGMFLFRIQPDSLLLMAGYGLAKSLTSILLDAALGAWIDRTGRLRAAQILLLVQNSACMLACCILAVYFHYHCTLDIWALPELVAAAVMILALIASLASTGSRIVVEKDWIVIISQGDQNRLAHMNAVFRTIDLTCLTATPVLAGLLFTYINYVVTAAVIGVWNLVSVVLEYLLLITIYRQFPQLAKEKSFPAKKKTKSKNCLASFKGWAAYMRHDVRYAGLALAFIYMTVLGFDNITWGYSLMQCVTESILGMLVAVSAGVGIMGSLSFPFFRRSLGAARAGLIGLAMQISTLSLCVISIWLPGSPFDLTNPEPTAASGGKVVDRCVEEMTDMGFHNNRSNGTVDSLAVGRCEDISQVDFTSVGVLLTGIILARYGLWVADLSITQIFQENVEEHQRGVLGGVQNSLNSTMDLIKFLFVLFLPYQNTFGILILLSFSFVCGGGTLMLSYNICKKKVEKPAPPQADLAA